MPFSVSVYPSPPYATANPLAALTWAWSFALEDGVLPDEATEAGLLGAASFFKTRDLSKPFSGGE